MVARAILNGASDVHEQTRVCCIGLFEPTRF
jgi:hypothetical protein